MARTAGDIEDLAHVEEGGEHRFSLRVPEDHVCFDGHFPGDPLMPAAAQLDGVVLPRIERLWPDLGPPRGAPRLKFHRPVRPGAELELQLVRDGSVVRFRIEGGDGACASGSLSWEREA